jgi:ABC-type polysaccharide/polyol phosphate export permease
VDKNTKFCPYCDAPIDFTSTATINVDGGAVAASNQVATLVTRYKDAYLVAIVTDGAGSLIKGVGGFIAGLLILIGALAALNSDKFVFALGILAAVFGVFIGLLFYLLGVLVSAQGQILKASLDCAVNSSPFLTNEHRAKLMSLPRS